MSCIEKFNPNENDYKTWKTLVHCKYIVSIEEQRLQIREKLHGNFLKNLYTKLDEMTFFDVFQTNDR